MKRPPRPPKENLFAGGMVSRIVTTAIIMAAGAIFIQGWCIQQGYSHRVQQTAVFTLLCFVQLMNALSVRSSYQSLFSKSIFTNRGMWLAIGLTFVLQLLLVNVPILQKIFKTESLPWGVIVVSFAVMLVFVIGVEVIKAIMKRKYLKTVS